MIATLAELNVGDCAKVLDFSATTDYFKQRLLAYGLFPGAKLEVVGKAPLGCPLQLETEDGLVIAIRKLDGANITVESEV